MLEVFMLLIAFQFKHFICDFPLQNQYMLGKMNLTNWKLPLAAHAAVHALGTFLITCLLFKSAYYMNAIVLGAILGTADFIIHFVVDRIKASPKLGGRFNPTQPYFWWALGADQMTHHLTHYLFIFVIVMI